MAGAPKKNITTTASLGLIPPTRPLKEEETEKIVDDTAVSQEEPAVSQEEPKTYKGIPLVQCRPKMSGRVFVGDKYWEYKGGEINTLPKTVKDILHSHGALDAI